MLMISKLSKRAKSLVQTNQHSIGIGKVILHYIRTVMNRIRWQQNRQLHSLQTRNSNIPKNIEQANKLFITTEKDISLNEKARMERIDNILGTNTYYQDVKVYQERLDSDHVMDLQELKKVHREQSRKVLNWLNPKADVQVFKYKHKKKHFQNISKLRIYPHHEAKRYDFIDQKNENTINFLGKEAVYSKISLKPVQLTVQSMQKQVIGLSADKPFSSEKYVYFRPIFTMQFFRIEKAFFQPNIVIDNKAFHQKQDYLHEIISLEQIYELLKDYDTDERVSEYLAKIENNRLEYFFSQFTYDKHQNVIAVVIDLLGTSKEYCLIVKNLSSPQSYKPTPIFNIRPQAIFSSDGRHICYVQRSPQGGWIQLVYRSVESCWKREEVCLADNENEEIMYRCDVQKQLSIGTDSNKNYIFVTVRDYGKEFSESLFLIYKQEEDALSLIQIESSKDAKYFFDVSPKGLIYSKFTQANYSYLKYGKNTKISKSVQLIPYKQHIKLHQQQQLGITQGLLPSSQTETTVIPPTEFDIANRKTIYITGENQFIRQIQVRQTHLILSLNLQSTYNKSILYFLPFKANSHPHSIILSGGTSIQLNTHSYNYNTQVVQFQKPNGLLLTEKVYNIWKKQLTDGNEDLKRYNYERIVINEDSYPIEVVQLYRSLYRNQRLPVLIYFASRNQEIQPIPLRQFLQKGVMIVEFRGRGTFTQDLSHYLNGSRHNFTNMLDDLQQLIEFIGNNMTKNISIYCKGEVSSLVGLWFNIYFPYLFNATVLHNGVFDLDDQIEMDKLKDFFTVKEKEKWEHFNVFKHQFKQTTLQTQHPKQSLGTLQNLIISSDQQHRIHSRKLIHKLRQSSAYRYEQVYLKQYDNEYECDLYNLSYFYSKIRTRMEEEINDPQYQDNP